MKKILTSILIAFMVVISNTVLSVPSAEAASFTYVTAQNWYKSYGGHHLYAYRGYGCTGTRTKLEKNQKAAYTKSVKSPWSLTFVGANGKRWNFPAKKCVSPAGNYVDTSYTNSSLIIVNKN